MSRRTILRGVIAGGCAALLLGAGVAAAQPWANGAGPRPDGTGVIPIGYRVTPAGHQSRLGDLPLSTALSPDGRTMLVANGGQGVQSLQVIDPADGDVRQTISYTSPQALFAGLAFAPDGRHAYASAGGNNKIRVYTVAGGRLTEGTPIALPTMNPGGQKVNLYPADLAVTPDGRRLVVADQLGDAATVVDLATGLSETTAVDHDPYGVAILPDGRTAYVTNQGANTVSVLDISGATPVVRATITVGTHPNRAVLDAVRHRLYVADGDSDQVSVIDTAANAVTATLALAPYPGATVGSNPDGLALSADGGTLYVANSGNNDVAVLDLRHGGRIAGLIPTGWYPTSVLITHGQLVVANAKGLGAGPNNGPDHPNPYSTYTAPDQYAGSMIVGTMNRVPLPISAGQLATWTRQVDENNGFGRRGAVDAAGDTSVVPRRTGEKSPIKHVIYIVRENRTYDQEFGSLGKGNGDPSLNLFGQESAPNVRGLARRYVTLDNFYANAEVSAQGWNWVVAANSNPYTEQTWVANYSGRNHTYPSESNDPAIAPNVNPADAYIWDRLHDAGVSFRNYGFYVDRDAATGTYHARDPILEAGTDHAFTGFNLSCADSPDTGNPVLPVCGSPSRFGEWKKEFDDYVAHDNLPSVEMVRLPNDHTAGTATGAPTPRAYVADNDWAVGQLVDAVSHSKYWSSTAVFVTEDDAQNGPDHVDAHRTTSVVVSPYTQTGRVDHTFYSTDSMLRTIELLSGLRPLTQFDAYATPMIPAFTNHPNFAPYTSVKPSQSLTEKNPPNAPMAGTSNKQDLSKEDQIDEQTFNQAIWQSVHGAGSTMPAPVHALWGAVPNNQAARHDDDDD